MDDTKEVPSRQSTKFEGSGLYSNIRVLKGIEQLQQGDYDLIVVPGYGFVGDNWGLSGHVKNRVKIASDLYKKDIARKIALSGRWSLAWERKGLTPPTTEAGEMQKFLLGLDVPQEDIVVEDSSMDSIGNAYFLKKDVIEKNGCKKVLVLCADYIVDRAKFCYGKMFEEEYAIDLLPTETPYNDDEKILAAQREMSQREHKFLSGMKKGDDGFWGRNGYKHPHYQEQRPVLVDQVGLGGNK